AAPPETITRTCVDPLWEGAPSAAFDLSDRKAAAPAWQALALRYSLYPFSRRSFAPLKFEPFALRRAYLPLMQSRRDLPRSLPCSPLASACLEHSIDLGDRGAALVVVDGAAGSASAIPLESRATVPSAANKVRMRMVKPHLTIADTITAGRPGGDPAF